MCNMLQLHMVQNRLNICICKPQVNNTYIKCIILMFLEVYFKKMCDFVNLLLKLNIYVFASRFKEFKYLRNDISSFYFFYLKIKIFCLLVYGSIVVKMDNSHSFEHVLKNLFHAKEAMGNEMYKQHGFFSYIYICVDVVHFLMHLVTMIYHKKYICLQTILLLHLCALHT